MRNGDYYFMIDPDAGQQANCFNCQSVFYTSFSFTNYCSASCETSHKERINNQKIRLANLLSSHKPKYKPSTISTTYKWDRDFLGRHQKGKVFCYGQVFDGRNWITCPLELEEAVFSGKIDPKGKIKDHKGNKVSWDDFVYLMLKSSLEKNLQTDEQDNSIIPVFSFLEGRIQFYRYAWGLQ